jgi:iron complex transport system ATP-binding protein
MIRTKKIEVSYGNKKIIDSVDIHIKKGTVNTLIGPNGSGKSTILKALTQQKKINSGEIFFKGDPIQTLSRMYWAKNVTYLPQNPKAPNDFTVWDLVSLSRNAYLKWYERLGKNDYEIIEESIGKTNIQDHKYKLLSELSGGERQRAWIAMALAQEPELIILDEPTTFLDIAYQFEVLEIIKELNEKENITVLMVLHDLNHAAKYSDNIVLLKKGKVFAEGAPKDVMNKENIREAFDIEVKVQHDEEHNYPLIYPIRKAV